MSDGFKAHDDAFPIAKFMLVVSVVVAVVVIVVLHFGVSALFDDCDKATDADMTCIGGQSSE